MVDGVLVHLLPLWNVYERPETSGLLYYSDESWKILREVHSGRFTTHYTALVTQRPRQVLTLSKLFKIEAAEKYGIG